VITIEKQYEACFAEPRITLDAMTSESLRRDPRHGGFVWQRYNFVAKMLKGHTRVAEIGCGGGFFSRVVGQEVAQIDLYDKDPIWRDDAISTGRIFRVHDIVSDGPVAEASYDGVYALDVLEHIAPADEPKAMANICASLRPHGVFIAGCPSLESQVHASPLSKAGHVNCRSGDDFHRGMSRWFHNVFMFGQNDAVVHTGFFPMCHYLLALCCEAREQPLGKNG
jgi:SAM-dependent methyltransferase